MSLEDEMKGKFTPVIVKVRQDGYVPQGMTVRAQISGTMFTADCESKAALDAARKDPLVESVSVSSIGRRIM